MPAPTDDHYRCIASERRRHVLAYLRESDRETESLDDLVEHVVSRESDSPPPDRERVAIDLYHCHLPVLADADVVDFDSRTETVRYRGHERVEALLDDVRGSKSGAVTERN